MSEERLSELLKHIHFGYRARLEARLGKLGLTPAQTAALVALGRSSRSSSAQLARACVVTRQSMNATVKSLADAKLVRRKVSDAAAHALGIELTDLGKARLSEARRVMLMTESDLVGTVPKAERKIFFDCLERCRANIALGV